MNSTSMFRPDKAARRASVFWLAVACVGWTLVVGAGCGTKNPPAPAAAAKAPAAGGGTAQRDKESHTTVTQHKRKAAPPPSPTLVASGDSPHRDASAPSFLNPELQTGAPSGSAEARSPAPLPSIDEDRIAANGIRKISGSRLTLYTDLPVAAAIDDLPRLFEQAVPQWCDYFHLGEAKLAQWHVRGCLMKDKERFITAGLLPPELPKFANGFTRDNEVWWLEQETDYYRRNLMLHEGTHSLMFAVFGTCGPPWYMEAVAELMGTHCTADGKLRLPCFPKTGDEAPNWGRIKLVRDSIRSGRALTINDIAAFANNAYLNNDAYGWSWALAAFLDEHPRYRERFRSLPSKLTANDFDHEFHALFADDWRILNMEWQAFSHEVDFGYDFARNAIKFQAAEEIGDSTKTLTIAADRGWQSSGIRLESGVEYIITAAGRYQLADQPKVWWSEPDGVTIRYHGGRPLGQLIAMVVADDVVENGRWPDPRPIGSSAKVAVAEPGTLYFKVNDLPSELADNAGSLEVTVALTQR